MPIVVRLPETGAANCKNVGWNAGVYICVESHYDVTSILKVG